MPIPDLPLFKHRDTVVTPSDQNQFVTQFETTMDTMSNDVIPAINDAITDINGKVITATTARDESEDARDIAVAAKDEALTAVATLQEGAIDNITIGPNKTFSNQHIENNYYDKDEVDSKVTINNFTNKVTPIDTDNLAIQETGGLLKKLSFANLKNWILSLFNPSLTGTVSFNSTTNNINLTNIVTALGLEIGDVIQISGSTNNNDYYTVEVITDNNNIIVNQSHANKSLTYTDGTRTKTLNTETSSVTIKLVSKYYNAPSGLGQNWVDVTSSRLANIVYENKTNRNIKVSIVKATSGASSLTTFFKVNGEDVAIAYSTTSINSTIYCEIPANSKYLSTTVGLYFKELR